MNAASFLMISVGFVAVIPILICFRAEKGFRKYSKRSIIFILLWLAGTYCLGMSDVLLDFSTKPPRFFLVLPSIVIGLFLLMRTSYASLISENTSYVTLIGLQSFRILPEIFLDMSYREGLAPIQMTYHGRNFDILVAVAAVLIFMLRNKISWPMKRVAIGFSIFGLGWLLNIIVVAIVSTPSFARYFMNEPANTFIARDPYIWLPTVLVAIALWGHFLLIKKILNDQSSS